MIGTSNLQVAALVVASVGVLFTGLYVALTYGLVRETRAQLRSANHPTLSVQLRTKPNERIQVEIQNDSHLPAFDIDVAVFPTYDGAKMGPSDFAKKHFREDHEKVDFSLFEEDEIEGGYFVLTDRFIRHRIPGGMRLEAEVHVPESDYVYLAIQYRSPLGVNYGQFYAFSLERPGDLYWPSSTWRSWKTDHRTTEERR